jgi:hypothetical protein
MSITIKHIPINCTQQLTKLLRTQFSSKYTQRSICTTCSKMLNNINRSGLNRISLSRSGHRSTNVSPYVTANSGTNARYSSHNSYFTYNAHTNRITNRINNRDIQRNATRNANIKAWLSQAALSTHTSPSTASSSTPPSPQTQSTPKVPPITHPIVHHKSIRSLGSSRDALGLLNLVQTSFPTLNINSYERILYYLTSLREHRETILNNPNFTLLLHQVRTKLCPLTPTGSHNTQYSPPPPPKGLKTFHSILKSLTALDEHDLASHLACTTYPVECDGDVDDFVMKLKEGEGFGRIIEEHITGIIEGKSSWEF